MYQLKTTFALLAVLTADFAPSIQADERNKETRLTISHPLQVQDTLLAPGQYDFKLIGPGVVSIYNVDLNRAEGLVVGWARVPGKWRRQEAVRGFSIARRDRPATLKTWFYPGDNSGLQFSTRAPGSEPATEAKFKRKAPATDAGDGASSNP
jgi:hypothetical protein